MADVATAPAHVLAARGDLANAAGDVVSRYFDIDGRPVPFEDEKLLLGLSRDQLRNAGTVIGVAAGAAKGPSILGAARAGLIDVLVTDDAAARPRSSWCDQMPAARRAASAAPRAPVNVAGR